MNVYLVEPHDGIRQRMIELLGEIPGIVVAGEADRAPAAIEGILQTRPEVVVMNLELKKGTGLDVVDAIRRSPLVPRVILMMDFGDGDLARTCQEAGADYCLHEENRFQDLCALLQQLAAGGTTQPDGR